jgi:hypothetical protein
MKTQVVTLALLTGLLGGCATAPHVEPISRETPVAFVVAMSQPSQGTNSVRSTAVTHDAVSGAMTGATAGALTGFLCGPLIVFCVPLGALMGAGAGVAAGATVGLAESVPKDKVALLDARLKRMQQSVDPLFELRTNVLDGAGKHWQLTDDTSGRVVSLEVQNLFLTSDRNKNIALVMKVLVSHRTGETAAGARPATPQRFVVITQGNSLAAWLDERSDLPEMQLRTACQQMATQVISQLAFN